MTGFRGLRARTWLPFCAAMALVVGLASRRWEAAVAVVALFVVSFAMMHAVRRCSRPGRSTVAAGA
jgi:4-hydroxybenzoate polyprenyltransferase